jgi:hypothetical protein
MRKPTKKSSQNIRANKRKAKAKAWRRRQRTRATGLKTAGSRRRAGL